MDFILTILAGIGIVLFIIGYLGFVAAGFRHHFVTGVISALPILNIVTIPALWRKASRKYILSTFGLLILVASWFLGANTGIIKLISLVKGENTSVNNPIITPLNTPSIVNKLTPEISISHDATSPVKPYANQQRIIDENNMQELPRKALYRMSFDAIPLDRIQTLKDRIVQIKTNNNEQLEGRVINITASSIFIQNYNGLENELPIANIKNISMMVKKAN